MTDLRVIALILDQGRQAADSMQDAPLSAVLARMTEAAIGYAIAAEPDRHGFPKPPGVWNVARDFKELSGPHR